MKLNDVKRFSAYVRTIYHSEYITIYVIVQVSYHFHNYPFSKFIFLMEVIHSHFEPLVILNCLSNEENFKMINFPQKSLLHHVLLLQLVYKL